MNNKVQTFPSNMVAGILDLKKLNISVADPKK